MTPESATAILETGDKLVAMLLVEDMKCEAEDVRVLMNEIRADMADEERVG